MGSGFMPGRCERSPFPGANVCKYLLRGGFAAGTWLPWAAAALWNSLVSGRAIIL